MTRAGKTRPASHRFDVCFTVGYKNKYFILKIPMDLLSVDVSNTNALFKDTKETFSHKHYSNPSVPSQISYFESSLCQERDAGYVLMPLLDYILELKANDPSVLIEYLNRLLTNAFSTRAYLKTTVTQNVKNFTKAKVKTFLTRMREPLNKYLVRFGLPVIPRIRTT